MSAPPLSPPIVQPMVQGLADLAHWRNALDQALAALLRRSAENELLNELDIEALDALRQRLAGDKLVLAFVAEFSRGKSELINAIFFADAGRRVLPATPGRTTMCPVELRWDPDVPPRLSLLPMQTRLRGAPMADLRAHDEYWQHVPLEPGNADALAEALSAVTQTQRVSVDAARELGLWHDDRPDDNPPLDADGLVEVPVWRHALIHYPHPLLQRGLVVLDTPGLNAIGAEPELTLGLLPGAHAVVFVLAADAGVTRSDLALWREHLGGDDGGGLQRYVVLNKIDTLADPLAAPQDAPALQRAQVARQCDETARTLGVDRAQVYPLSARDALAARVAGDDAALAASCVPALEAALAAELLPRRSQVLAQAASDAVARLRDSTLRRLADRRRHQSEQLLELRGLRGKSGGKLRLLVARLENEDTDFERCTAHLAALRAVQRRMLHGLNERLSSQSLRTEVSAMQAAMQSRVLHLGARAAFDTLLTRLGEALQAAQADADELQQMLHAGFEQINAGFGFSLVLGPAPRLSAYRAELDLIHDSYSRHLSLAQGWRLAAPAYAEQFRRMLLSRLRVVFERAAGEVELWHKSASSQVDQQLRERRLAFTRRRETLQRVQEANGELEQRIQEVQAQDDHLAALQLQWQTQADAVLTLARDGPGASEPVSRAVPGMAATRRAMHAASAHGDLRASSAHTPFHQRDAA